MNQKFHAHVYFDPDLQRSEHHSLRAPKGSQLATAEALYLAIHTLMLPRVRLGQFHLRLVGPHALPMFTVMFEASEKKEFTAFLERNREDLSILIHEDTGNDYRDHTQGVEWLGSPLPIHFEHFERIKNEKSALVFPES